MPSFIAGRSRFLDQAQQKLNAGDLAAAKSLVKQSNSLFTLLQKEYASVLAERELSPQEDQQLAINQKLADDTHAQADRLMATAAAQDKKAQELGGAGTGGGLQSILSAVQGRIQSGPKSLCQVGNFTPCAISRGSFASWRLDFLKAY